MDLTANLRYALRALLARPAFALTVIVTLAFGIGANAAVFSAVHGLLLRPLPFPDAERLIQIEAVSGGTVGRLASREIREIADSSRFLSGVAAYYPTQYNLTGGGAPEAVSAIISTHNLFDVLGVPMLYGSSWPGVEDWTLQYRVVMNHGLWTRRYGADPGQVGRTVLLDAHGYSVEGVLPAGFDFPARVQMFRAVTSFNREDARRFSAVARLHAGATLRDVQSELDQFSASFAATWPSTNTGVRLHAVSLRDAYVGAIRPHLLLLTGAVALVWLLACANVSNLMLTRAVGRRTEIALRLALGADRRHVAALLLTESVLLTGAGTVLGLLIARATVNALAAAVPVTLPLWITIEITWPVLLFTAAVAALTACLIGLLPALHLSRAGVPLRADGRGTVGDLRQQRARTFLVAAQAALSVVLLIGSALVVQSLWRLSQVELGFDPARVLTFRADPPWKGYESIAQISTFYRRAVERLEQLPGVELSAATHVLPLSGLDDVTQVATLEGQTEGGAEERPFVNVQTISPGYFRSMRVPLLQGRFFDDHDREDSMPVAIVSARTAARLWPGDDPLGRRLRLTLRTRGTGSDNTADRWLTVVGVVGDVRSAAPHVPPALDVYVSHDQAYAGDIFFVVRTAGAPGTLGHAVGPAIREIDPDQSTFDVQTMEQRVAGRVWQQRAAGAVLTALAGLAVLLASLGVYAVVSYAVAERAREMGVRLALGAPAPRIAGLVVRQGMTPVVCGLAAGLFLAAVAARWIEGLLYEVGSRDVATFLLVPLLLAVVSLAACCVPARRAMRLDPIVVLRSE